MPTVSLIIPGKQPLFATITGLPHDKASRVTLAKPSSYCDGKTPMSALP